MVEQKPPIEEIHSFDEIPVFSNEEEEAQFWDAHTLSDDLVALMGPLSEEVLPIDSSRTSRKVDRKLSLEKTTNPTQLSTGQIVSLSVGNESISLIVISPDGLGPEKPKLGISLRTLSALIGISVLAIRSLIEKKQLAESPSSDNVINYFNVIDTEGRQYTLIELSDCLSLVLYLLAHSRLNSSQVKAISSFIHHFSVLGIYAQAYANLKGSFSSKDKRSTTKWIGSKTARWLESSRGHEAETTHKLYLDLLESENEGTSASYWTNYIYKGLVGLNAGNSKYINDLKVREAIHFCEGLVIALFLDDLEEAHDRAIDVARSEFFCKEVDITPFPVKS